MAILTEEQASALQQLQDITQSLDPDRERAVLASVGWDVQRAAQAIFDAPPTQEDGPSQAGPSHSSRPSASFEPMELDDSMQSSSRHTPTYRPVQHNLVSRLGLQLFSIITFPLSISLSIVTSLLHFVFRVLRVPFPRSWNSLTFTAASARNRNRGRPLLADDPSSVADRFVRELEDETGAMCVSRAAAVANEEGNGNAGLEKSVEGRGRLLPDFWIGSYESALKAAEAQSKVLCVILLSEEHDDVPEFRRTVLTDADFVRVLTENSIIVWAGDVRDREAYQASLKLTATTYPFVAFISLRPSGSHRANNAPSSSTPQLTVLSRHQGTPHNTGPTSASTLHTHITSSLLPRVTPLLNRLRQERRAREQERELRAEQDRAFEEAKRKDKERIEKKMAEERKKNEEEAEKERLELEKVQRKLKRVAWRRWARRALVGTEDTTSAGIRIGVRLPDGRRIIRRFSPKDSLTSLYAFVDTQFIGADSPAESDPEQPPEGYVNEWEFKLVTTYPRQEIEKDVGGKAIGEVEGLGHGANLVVEMTRAADEVIEGSDEEE